jgi:hypothetical protein
VSNHSYMSIVINSSRNLHFNYSIFKDYFKTFLDRSNFEGLGSNADRVMDIFPSSLRCLVSSCVEGICCGRSLIQEIIRNITFEVPTAVKSSDFGLIYCDTM